ncbi:MAG: recombinase RecT [Sulfurimonas sp.]|jgi:recombination protein RecT|nr:recombinase RecT [Sulfurimonas sp.]
MSNEIVDKRKTQIDEGLIAQHQMIKSLLGDKDKASKFTATAAKVANDYKLRECRTQSILDACINVAQLGLDLSPNLSHAYLVPFKANKDAKVASVQLIISARGYTALLARTGWSIKSFIVTESDEFDYRMNGFEEVVTFIKDLDSVNPKFKYAVAMAKSPNGEIFVEVMNKSEIEKHRMVSSNQNTNTPTGVWFDWYNPMALKTVTKKLTKKLPIGEDIANAVFADDKVIEAELIPSDTVDKKSDMNSL